MWTYIYRYIRMIYIIFSLPPEGLSEALVDLEVINSCYKHGVFEDISIHSPGIIIEETRPPLNLED